MFLQQISRRYRPLLPFNLSLGLESDEEKKSGAQLLRLHNKPDTPPSALFPQNNNLKGEGRAAAAGVALADVWDGREELFGVNKAEDEDEGEGCAAPGETAFCETRNLQNWAGGSA
jgi:hypothetical protein